MISFSVASTTADTHCELPFPYRFLPFSNYALRCHNYIPVYWNPDAYSINRRYRAICFGELKQEEGTIDQPIGRHPNDRKKMAINHQNGKRAVTHYRVLQRFQGYTYIECVLETGRTHQIRVHMASIGHPILGDDVYGPAKCPFHLEGQTLHAKILGITHPATGEYMEFDAPLPEYFMKLLSTLRQKK